MADGTITVEVSTQAAQDELQRLRDQNATLKRDLQYARDGLTKGRTRMREDIERLTAENAALKREAHTWWAAARDATKAETERCALVAALHSQYPVTTDYDRGYAKARADAAAAIRVGPNDRGETGPTARTGA